MAIIAIIAIITWATWRRYARVTSRHGSPPAPCLIHMVAVAARVRWARGRRPTRAPLCPTLRRRCMMRCHSPSPAGRSTLGAGDHSCEGTSMNNENEDSTLCEVGSSGLLMPQRRDLILSTGSQPSRREGTSAGDRAAIAPRPRARKKGKPASVGVRRRASTPPIFGIRRSGTQQLSLRETHGASPSWNRGIWQMQTSSRIAVCCVLVFMALLSGAGRIEAQGRWRVAAESATNAVAIDTTSIRTVAGIKSIWVKTTPFTPKDSAPPRISQTVNSYSLKCASRQFSLVQSVDYDADGNSLGILRINSEFDAIPPESLAEILFEAACLGKWRKTLLEQMTAYVESATLDLWRSQIAAKCPGKKIPTAVLLRSFRMLPPEVRMHAADSITQSLCQRAR